MWAFLRARRKFWMIPMLVVMMLFGMLMVLTQGTAVAPFIYTLF
jgi:competence protein ComGC